MSRRPSCSGAYAPTRQRAWAAVVHTLADLPRLADLWLTLADAQDQPPGGGAGPDAGA